MDALIKQLFAIFPAVENLEVSGWNNYSLLDSMIDPKITFHLNLINTFILFATEEEKKAKIREIADISKNRKVTVCVQSMIKAHDTIDESFDKFNRFMDMVREMTSN
jgi:hypothetical protein